MAGVAITVDPVVVLRSAPGLHTYVSAPLADNTEASPVQIEPSVDEAFRVILVTAKETVDVSVHPLAAVPTIV
jgi:hypothetical protein